jgi:hypothetical protein
MFHYKVLSRKGSLSGRYKWQTESGFKKHLTDRTGGRSPFRRRQGIKNSFLQRCAPWETTGSHFLSPSLPLSLSLTHIHTHTHTQTHMRACERVCVVDHAWSKECSHSYLHVTAWLLLCACGWSFSNSTYLRPAKLLQAKETCGSWKSH